MMIDAHVHLYDEGFRSARWSDNVAYRWGKTPPEDRDPGIIRPKFQSGWRNPTGSLRLKQMDAAGLDPCVVLPLDWEIGMRQKQSVPIEHIHERYAAIAQQNPGWFVIFAGFDPQSEDVVQRFEWAIKTLGMKGLKLYPPTGFYPYDKAVYPLYERCEAWGLPVLVHTGGTIDFLKPCFASPLYLQDVRADFPRMNLWFGHAGATFWLNQAVAVATQGANIYLELSNWEDVVGMRRCSSTKSRARPELGAHRILFGSDHFSGPKFWGQEKLVRWHEWFQELPDGARKLGITFTEEEIGLILGGNAARCLTQAGAL